VAVTVPDAVASLAQNIALLLSLTLLYGVIRPYSTRLPHATQPIVAGVLFGLIATAAMHTPFVIAPGVIGDARLIPVLLAGPFGGRGAALTAAALAAGYRAWLGGVGSAAGIGSILTTGLFGLAVALAWRRQTPQRYAVTFVLLGFGLDAIVLAWVMALPDAALAQRVLAAAAVPVGLFLPFGTLVLGMLLVHERSRQDERERLALTQFAIERSTEALFWIDADGRIVNANAAAGQLTGYRKHELLGRPVWELESEGSPEQWQAFWVSVRAGARHADRHYLRRGGTTVPVETSNDFVAYGGHEWISVFARDVSDRRLHEQERAEQLTREQALRVRAEEANVMKDQFLATLSHELRTPLTSILGYTRLLRRGTLPASEAGRALDTIERNALAQTQIVDDLLDVSSIVLGKLAIGLRPVQFVDIVDREVQTARLEAAEAGLALDSTLPHDLPPVAGDVVRLQQVVHNLLSNAVKFTPPGGRVRVHVDQDGSHARLSVSDTGVGIAPTFLPYVFDRFRQADSSMTRTHGGLGLGLAVVRALVELHGGSVIAESPGDGAGATFTVRLPLLNPAPEEGALGEVAQDRWRPRPA
jgi:PAS domain S-box-containing protein